MKPSRPARILALAALGGWLYGEALLTFAARRESRLVRLLKAQKAARADPRLTAQVRAAAQAAEALPVTPVTLTARDGTTLAAHFLPAQGAPRRTVVLAHGWRTSWPVDFGAVIPFLRRQGCHLLLLGQRGQGESGGDYITFGQLERFDLLDWVGHLPQLVPHPLPVYLYGMSMGAATALLTTALPLPGEVRGVIADCGFTTPQAVMTHALRGATPLPDGPSFALANALLRLHTGLDFNACAPLDVMPAARVPILFIHGDADPLVPVEMSRANYAACGGPKELLIVPGAGHTMSYLTAPEAYEDALTAFFERCEG